MRSTSGVRLEWLFKAGAAVLAAVLVMLTLNSLQLLFKTKDYLEGELEARLMNLKEIIAPELSAKFDRGLDLSEYLGSVAVRESLVRVRIIGLDRRTIADSTAGTAPGKIGKVPGLTEDRLRDVWDGLTVVSPVYDPGNGLVRSLYFPMYDRPGRLSAVCELTIGASHLEDLAELGTTHFLIKSLVVIVLITGLLYMMRTLIQSQRKMVQAASGANIGAGQPRTGDDVTFVINSFQAVVRELQEKERELRELKDRAEERARRIENYNENVLRNVQSGVVTFDVDGTVRTMNPAAVEMLGMGEQAAAGREVCEVFEGGAWLCELVTDTLSRAQVKKRGEGGYVAPDGSRRWLGAGTSPMVDDEGGLTGAILVFADLSEVKQLREKIELRERMTLLGEMSAGIAHELRNPMAVISGYAKLLAKRMDGDAESLEAVESMQEEISGMDEIIREFMNFARPAELNLTDMEIAPVLEDAVKSAAAAAGGNAGIRLDVREGLPTVFGDPLLLKQAFINIVQNGVEAMEGGGELSVKAGLAEPAAGPEDTPTGGRLVRIDFEDHGRGIPDADLKKIFTPFFTTKARGTGLGLALVQKILVYHGGRVSVRSVEGEGATFTVYLPVGPHGEGIDG